MTSPQSPTLTRVVKGRLCSGCGVCAGLAPAQVQMREMAPGYNRPLQNAPVPQAVEELIANACPGAVVAPWPAGPNVDPYWGPWRQVLTGYAMDERVRYEGSSGGVLSALLIHALNSGMVDRVVHIHPDPSSPTRNLLVSSRTPDEVLAGAGSRYVASSPLADIGAQLEEGGRFAFVGKPCDVSALRMLARLDSRVSAIAPLALSFFCGGMPSHAGVERILDTMGVEQNEVATFRYRGQGWPGTAAATTRSGEVVEMSYAESWGAHLSKEVQFRCKICPDAVGGGADLACADAWYGDAAGYPSFDEADGRSLIIARTSVGEELLQDALRARVVTAEKLDLAEIERMQPSQASRKRMVRARTAALSLTLQPQPSMRGLMVREASGRAGAVDQLRNVVGTVRRILNGRR